MKKVVWFLAITLVVGFIILSNNPVDEIMNFIIGGSIPGTKIVLGFWPSLGLIALLLWLVRRAASRMRLQMMKRTTEEIKIENAKIDFQNTNNPEQKHKNRSVIAARSIKTTS